MRTMKRKDLVTFEKMCSLNQPALKKFMSKFLRTKYEEVYETKDFICAFGDIPIALVAHMDTVFKTPPEDFYFDPEKNVLWSPQGLGADDRAGVFSILSIVKDGLKPHIILTTDEEIGGVGALALTEFEKPFEDLRYIIELDRRGSDDCVFYDCDNKDFVTYVEKFGFSENWGTFSDISTICPEWGVAGVNLSIGYQNEHSSTETLHIGNMLNTIDKVKKMLTEKEIPFFEYIEDPDIKYWERYCKAWSMESGYRWTYGDNWVVCHDCGNYFPEEETFPVRLLSGAKGYYCPDHIVDKVGWCEYCTEAFEIDTDGDSKICPLCKKALNIKENDDDTSGSIKPYTV